MTLQEGYSYITAAFSLTSSMSLGPQIFVASGVNLLIRSLPFMSTFHNPIAEAFLRGGSMFIDFDFMPIKLLDIFNIQNSTHFVILAPSIEAEELGLSTLTSALTFFIKLIQCGLICSGISLLTTFLDSLSSLSSKYAPKFSSLKQVLLKLIIFFYPFSYFQQNYYLLMLNYSLELNLPDKRHLSQSTSTQITLSGIFLSLLTLILLAFYIITMIRLKKI
jgi:hypothetical protein